MTIFMHPIIDTCSLGVVTSVIRNIAGYLPSPSSDNTSDVYVTVNLM